MVICNSNKFEFLCYDIDDIIPLLSSIHIETTELMKVQTSQSKTESFPLIYNRGDDNTLFL